MEPWKSEGDILNRNDVPVLDPLPKHLEPLAKEYAARLHLQWGISRMRRGFKYGPKRTEDEHPNLVQFLDLPTHCQQQDESDSNVMLSMLHSMGYRIVPAGKILSYVVVWSALSFMAGILVAELFLK